MKILKQTPIHTVTAIEPLLPFWTANLGYEQVAAVPSDGPLAFAMLERDGAAVMLQTAASVATDLGPDTPLQAGSVCLYVDVDDIEEAIDLVRQSGVPILCGPRDTFHGAREIFFVAPGGMVVGFAEHRA